LCTDQNAAIIDRFFSQIKKLEDEVLGLMIEWEEIENE